MCDATEAESKSKCWVKKYPTKFTPVGYLNKYCS